MPDVFEIRREDLYEQVWSEPVVKVAARYGVSGTALSKICRKAAIPVPPVGHWQRLQFGYKPARLALPVPPQNAFSVVRVEKRPPKRVVSPEIQAEVTREEEGKNRVHVAERLTRPHTLVQRTAEALRSQQADVFGMLYRPRKERTLDLRVSSESLPRALRIMDALVKALEARGVKVIAAEGEKSATVLELHGEKVAIALYEKSKREEHVLTKDERERKAKYSWSSAPRWDHHPSGILQLQIKEGWGRGVRKTWSDGEKRQLEDELNGVIAGLMVVAEAKRAEQRELERQREAWVEAERRRQKEEELRRAEAERLKALEQEASSWTKSQQIVSYADAVEREALTLGVPVTDGSRAHAWLLWVRAYAARLDPVVSVVAALDARAPDDKSGARLPVDQNAAQR